MSQSEELIQIFSTESKEIIDLLDQNIVLWENEPDNRALLDDIFRAFHTLKGNAGIVGMHRFEKIAHITEEILTEIRDGKRKIQAEVITFLLDSLDQIKILQEAIETTGSDQAEVKEIPPPDRSKKASAKKTTEKKTQKTKSSAKTKKASPKDNDEILSEDGSWGLFAENISTPQEDESKEENTEPEATENQATKSDKQNDGSNTWNKADSTIRVDVSLLDSLMNRVGELVLSRNQIMQFVPQMEDANFHAASQRLNLCTSELQESIMKTRMQPISNVFNRFPRVVRDITQSINKNVTLKLEGAETELDKTIIEGIRDPLTHLVRNAIDHGVEDEQTRTGVGKDPKGTVILRAFHEGGQVNIEIVDDGAGIIPDKIRQKAVEKDVITPQQAETISDREAINLIFRAGFSTAEKVTNISGRGVGMDVVRTNIEKIGGNVEILSEAGNGSTIKIKIPLTLAIIPALIVTAGGQRFAIPQINLLELVRLEGDKIKQVERIGNAETYRLRGKLLPILRLNSSLGLKVREQKEDRPENISIVVLAAGEMHFGLIVDRIHDTEEIVVKPLSKHLKEITSFAGATVMGDGKVALILDAVGLAESVEIMTKGLHKSQDEAHAEVIQTQLQKLLLFSIHPDEQFAIPISMVSRLEKFITTKLQTVGNHEAVHYRGKILPLLRIENSLNVSRAPKKDTFSVIVFCINGHELGFIVSEIIDIISTEATVDTQKLKEPGVLGSVLIHGKITRIIDVFKLVKQGFPNWLAGTDENAIAEDLIQGEKVLVVDDSPFIRAIERSYLEADGFQVIEAGDGEEALDFLATEEIHFVVTDIEMPKMNGLDLSRNIRANDKFSDVQIVAVSSLDEQGDIERGKEAGINVYLPKTKCDSLATALRSCVEQNEVTVIE